MPDSSSMSDSLLDRALRDRRAAIERAERAEESLDLYHAFVLGLLIGQPRLQESVRAEWEARRKEARRG